MSEMFR